jgi:SAM-dependent methyltransferase
MINYKQQYNSKRDVMRNQHAILIDLIRKNNYKTLLDLGCGDADKALFFALELNLKVLALDEFEGHGSDVRVEDVLEKVRLFNLEDRIEIKEMDALNVHGLDQTFDVVFTQNVLHHIFPWPSSRDDLVVETFFHNIWDRITPGGILYIVDSGPWNFWDRLACRFPGRWYQANLFRSINTVRFENKTPVGVWKRRLERIGFRPIRTEYHVPYPLRKLRPFLNNAVVNLFIESSYIMISHRPV